MKTKQLYYLSIFLFIMRMNASAQPTPWQPTSQPPGGSIWALTTIGNNVFAGATNGGVYYSPDGGKTWIQRNGAFPGIEVRSLAAYGNDLFAGTQNNGAIYKSSDFGLTWMNITPTGFPPVANVYALVTDGNDIYAGLFGTAGVDQVLKSPLSGISSSSWTVFNTGLPTCDIRSLAFMGQNILAGTYGQGVYVSPKSGSAWNSSSSGIGSSADYIQTIAANGPDVFAGNVSGTPLFYHSSDYGANWVQCGASIWGLPYAVIIRGISVYFGTESGGVFRSTDNGLTWTNYSNGLGSNATVRSFAFLGDTLFAGTDGGVWKLTTPHDSTLNLLTGSVFFDLNANCTADAADSLLSHRFLLAQDASSLTTYGTTDAAGNFKIWVPAGTYSVSMVPKSYWNQVCPSSPQSYIVGVAMRDTVDSLNFGTQISSYCPDLAIGIGAPRFRRCMKNTISVQCWNNGTTTATNTLLKIDFDPPFGRVIPITSTVVWDSVSGSSYFWKIASVQPGQYVSFNIADSISCNSQLGDTVGIVARILNVAGDCNGENNSDEDHRVIIGSFDPNEKLASTTSNKIAAKQASILPTDTINYTICFQNTGSDTAFKVVVYDTLDSHLKIPSVISGASSHPYTFELMGKGILKWTFDNILLPDSNVNELGSHGFVKFRILQDPNNTNGTVIKNRAGIVFDFNAPVITNESVLTISLTGIEQVRKNDNMTIFPNPAIGKFWLQCGNMEDGPVRIEICNLLGESVQNMSIGNGAVPGPIEVDISSQPEGLYFIRMNTAHGIVTRKIALAR